MSIEQLGAGLGVVLIAAVILEVFRDLFHPAHGGALSDWIGRRLFRSLRAHRTLFPAAGPLAVVLVIGSWVLLLGLGFALVYDPGYPQQFRTSTGAVPPSQPDFLAVLYFSFATLTTLGYGDIIPESSGMRLLAALEALVGFGLLTASVSALVLLYPALSRMRLLARHVSNLVRSSTRLGHPIGSHVSDGVLFGLARDVTNVRIDLVHFPITYYFGTTDEQASVARWLPDLARLACESLSPEIPPATRVAAGVLDEALTDLANLLVERFLDIDARDRDAVFRAFARDHRIQIRAGE